MTTTSELEVRLERCLSFWWKTRTAADDTQEAFVKSVVQAIMPSIQDHLSHAAPGDDGEADLREARLLLMDEVAPFSSRDTAWISRQYGRRQRINELLARTKRFEKSQTEASSR